jgi:L-fuconolactonase
MIDAHVHVWRLGANGCTWPPPELAAIHRDFTLADYRAASSPAIDRVILVQSQEDPADTSWLLSLAEADPLVAGVVGWSPLTDAAAIDALARHPKLVALRPMVQDRSADWFDAPALDPALAAMARHGLVLDALIRPRHLPALARLAARHPALRIVVDHAAKPEPGAVASWAEALRAVAARPNAACKLSGLLTELPAEAIPEAIAVIRAAFGPDRLLWGSDWPVLTLADSFAAWLDRARALVPEADHPAVFGGTARTFYGLPQ